MRPKNIIAKNLDYQLNITRSDPNPYSYPRQTFLFKNKIQDGFFIPHENETGWWWQGEDARLASLAAASFAGEEIIKDMPSRELRMSTTPYAYANLHWILGNNPYNLCFLYGFGKNNPV